MKASTVFGVVSLLAIGAGLMLVVLGFMGVDPFMMGEM